MKNHQQNTTANIRDRIAVLIPCYNEAVTIGKVVTDLRHALPEDTVIYVYDNNSTDGTAGIAREAGALVRHESRQGKGNVLRTMFRDIEADCYVMIDGDDTYPVEPLAGMCGRILAGGADMVVGDRLSTTYSVENKRRYHNSGNKVVRRLINLLFKGNVNDIMSGCRAMSRNFVKNFPILKTGFEIETEMTIHALDKNYVVETVPIAYRDRPQDSHSKLNTISDGYKVLKTILTLFVVYKPLIFFFCLSLILMIGAVAALVPVFVEYFHTGLVPRFPTLFVGCSLIVMAMLLLICGIILKVNNLRHRQLLELLSNLQNS